MPFSCRDVVRPTGDRKPIGNEIEIAPVSIGIRSSAGDQLEDDVGRYMPLVYMTPAKTIPSLPERGPNCRPSLQDITSALGIPMTVQSGFAQGIALQIERGARNDSSKQQFSHRRARRMSDHPCLGKYVGHPCRARNASRLTFDGLIRTAARQKAVKKSRYC
jgi:hypothetical protein